MELKLQEEERELIKMLDKDNLNRWNELRKNTKQFEVERYIYCVIGHEKLHQILERLISLHYYCKKETNDGGCYYLLTKKVAK